MKARKKYWLSILLSFGLLVGLLSAFSLTAFAEESTVADSGTEKDPYQLSLAEPLASPVQTHTDHTGWTELTKDSLNEYGYIEIREDGKYYLGEDMTKDLISNLSSSVIRIYGSPEVTLCLNGHTLASRSSSYSAGSLVRLESTSTLNICDCQGGGVLEGGGEVTTISGWGTIYLYDGTVRQTYRSGTAIMLTSDSSALYMYGGRVESSGWYAIENHDTGTVDIDGGVIVGGEDGILMNTSRGGKLFLSGDVSITNGESEYDEVCAIELNTNPMIIDGPLRLTDDTPITIGVVGDPDEGQAFTFATPGGTLTSLADYAGLFRSAHPGWFAEANGVNLQLTPAAITEQPSDDNGYTVAANGSPSYQWYTVKKEPVPVDDKRVVSVGDGVMFGSYWFGDRWEFDASEVSELDVSGSVLSPVIFTIDLEQGDVLVANPFCDEGIVRNVSLASETDVAQGTQNEGSWTFTAPSDGTYTLTVTADFGESEYREIDVTVKATGPVADTALAGQTAAALNPQDLPDGQYLCAVSWEDGNTLLYSDFVTLVAHSHSWSDTWNSDASFHWHECTEGCPIINNSEKDRYGEHTWAEATCTAPKTCSVCGKTEGNAAGHDFTYAATGSILTESCSRCNLSATAEIKAPVGTLVYDGSREFPAAVLYSDEWGGERNLSVSYTKNDAVTTDFTGAGVYIASITVGEGENARTARVTYTVNKKDQDAKVSYGGHTYGADTLTAPTLSGAQENPSVTYYYNTTNSSTGGEPWSGLTGTTLLPNTYYVYGELAATDNYNAYTTAAAAFTVDARAFASQDITVAGYSEEYDGQPHGIVVTVPQGAQVAYGAQSGVYDQTSIPLYTDAGTYTVYYEISQPGYISETGSAIVTIQPKTVNAPVIELGIPQDGYTYDGIAKEPAVTVKDGETVIPSTEYAIAYSNNINAGTDTAVVTITDKANGNYTVSGSKTFSIALAAQTAPEAGVGYIINYKGEEITAQADYELAVSPDASIGSGTLPLTPGTDVYIRLTGDENHKPSDWVRVTIPARPSAPGQAIIVKDETVKGAEDGKLTGLTETMEYRIREEGQPGFGDWIQTIPADGVLPVGNNVVVEVRYEGDEAHFPGETSTYTITPSQETLTVTYEIMGTGVSSAPQAVTGLSYNAALTEPAAPTRNGFTFAGWYHGDTLWSFAGGAGDAHKVTENLTLTDKWTLDVPAINNQTADASPVYGTGSLLEVQAAEYADTGITYNYQWYSNTVNSAQGGTPIAGGADSGYRTPDNNVTGTYYYYCVITADAAEGSESITSDVIAVQVQKKALTPSIALDADSKMYDGTVDVSGAGIVLAGGVNGENPTASASFAYDDKTVSGASKVIADNITLDSAWTTNYELATSSAEIAASITARPVTIVCADNSKIYGDPDPALTGTVTGVLAGEDLSVQFLRESGEDKAVYAITADYSENSNYSVQVTPAAFTIQPKVVTLAWTAPAELKYDGSPKVPTVVVSNKVAGDEVTVSAALTVGTDNVSVGSFTFTTTGLTGADSENYSLIGVDSVSDSYTIIPAELSGVSVAQNGTLTYNGLDQTAAVTTAAAAVNAQTVTYEYSAEADGTYSSVLPAFKTAGEHTVYYKVSAPNHNSKTGSFSVTIERAVLTVTAENKGMTLGGAIPSYTVTYSGLLNGETAAQAYGAADLPTAACTADGKTANTYPITVSGEEILDNYRVTYQPGVLTVNPFTITFNANGGEGEMAEQLIENANTPLSENSFTFGEHKFSGWNTAADGTGTACGDKDIWLPSGENRTLYAQWTAADKFIVSGIVKDDASNPLAGVRMELRKGETVIAFTTADAKGKFLFANVTEGAYNVVAHENYGMAGEKTVTVLKDVYQDLSDVPVVIPADKVSSKLAVKETAAPVKNGAVQVRDVVVGGLDAEADQVKDNHPAANTITVTMTAAQKTIEDTQVGQDATAAEKEAAEALKKAMDAIGQISGAAGKTMEYLDVSVTKQVDGGEITPVSTTTNVLEIVIPFQVGNRQNVTLFQYSVGDDGSPVAAKLTEQAAKTGAAGEYYLDKTNQLIYVYTKDSALYAVGYNMYSSGGGQPSNYKVNLTPSAQGEVSSDVMMAQEGRLITLTVTPDEGFAVAAVTVTDKDGKAISLKDEGDGKYTFKMPASSVIVTVSYAKAGEESGTHHCFAAVYTDVDTTQWYHESIDYVLEKGLMNGTSAATFRPGAATSRAMIVTILWRQENQSAAEASDFLDVASGQWYSEAVAWASANGIVTGYPNGTYAPNQDVTREQLAAILYRYAQFKGYDVSIGENTNILSYNDASQVSEYAIPAMQWACGEGIMNGSNGNLMPLDGATRAQTAAMLMRFIEGAK